MGEVCLFVTMIVALQLILELVEPLYKDIVVSVSGIFERFPHLGLFRPLGSHNSMPYFPMDQVLDPLEQYHVMVLLGVPQSIVWRCMGYPVCGDTGRSQWIWSGSKQRCFHF